MITIEVTRPVKTPVIRIFHKSIQFRHGTANHPFARKAHVIVASWLTIPRDIGLNSSVIRSE